MGWEGLFLAIIVHQGDGLNGLGKKMLMQKQIILFFALVIDHTD